MPPAPKRESQRRRRNKVEPATRAPSDGTVYGEPLEGEHSEQARRFWEALRTSGQAQFYEPSDWAVAELIVVAIDSFIARPSAMMLASLNSSMSALLVTEADRRRAKLELDKTAPAPVVDDVAELDDFRLRLAN